MKSHPKNLVVLSQSIQARRLRELLTNPKASHLKDTLAGESEILFLRWSGSDPYSPEWHRLHKVLETENVTHHELPRNPNFLSRPTKFVHLEFFERTLDERPSLQGVILFSYYSHYGLLAKMAKERGLRLTLIEEGLHTYRGIAPSTAISEPPLLMQFFYFTLMLLKDLWRAVRVYTDSVIKFFTVPHASLEVAPLGFRLFDQVYSNHPEVASIIFPEATMFDISPGNFNPAPEDRQHADSIFFGQTYLLSVEATRFIVQKALEIATGRVIFSFHPRAEEQWIKIFQTAIKGIPQGRLVINNSGMTAEQLIKTGRYEWAMSLTSTVLLEAQLWDPGVKISSLCGELLDSKHKIRWRVRNQLRSDHEVMTAVRAMLGA